MDLFFEFGRAEYLKYGMGCKDITCFLLPKNKKMFLKSFDIELVENRGVAVTLETCEVDRLISVIIYKVDGKHAYSM